MMACSECGREEPALKTVYWMDEGDWADERPLCDRCHGYVADKVLIVAGPAYCWGTCRGCGEWFSVRDLSDRAGGGRYSSPSGLCVGCAGGA